MGEQKTTASSVNRAKTYQLVLFPLNNGATNVYYVLVLSYIATFGSKVLALSMLFASVMVTGMRLFDAVTDPIIGALMDRTNGRFGKFRPFMVIGNLIMAASILVLYCLTPLIPAIPMVADCSDYETYRSGKYIPGIMGTLFSLVDKLVSSLSATVVGIAVSFVGLQSLPTQYDPYTPGMNWVVIVLFCIIPMVAWAATLIAMKGYTLTGAKMKEIQAVNACRRDAVAKGMKLEEAMDKWQTLDQLPAEYRS